jgi:two-component system sensor histidine kinase BaeS
LTLAIVGLLTGALLLAGAGALLVNRSATRHDTQQQLASEANAFVRAAGSLRSPKVLELVERALRLENAAVIVVTPQGSVSSPLPAGLVPSQLDVSSILSGQRVEGWAGTLSFVAAPVVLSPALSGSLPAGDRVALVVTRRVGLLGTSWAYFLLASGVVLVIGAVVSAELSRRITRPVVEASAVARRIAGGELSARAPVAPDEVAELASLANSINAMATGLEEARERESRLLLSVSHDLRTPLTSIRGYAEAIHDGVAEPSQASGVILSETQRLQRLVADLLDLAKIDSQHLSLRLGPTDVSKLVSEAAEAAGPRAQSRGIRLLVTGPASASAIVLADTDRLHQVVSNLIENAIDFARGSVLVSVHSGNGGRGTELVFEDDGSGIPPADLTRVFDRFYQVDSGASSRGGSGLGLSIVKELVHAMGGAVHAVSPLGPGGGTRMIVSLRPWEARHVAP